MYQSEEILKNNKLETIIEKRNKKINIIDNQEVVVFGCGKIGKSIIDNSLKSKIRVKCFIDNYQYVSKSYNGVKIYNLKEFLKKYNKELIILASIIHDVDMAKELMQYNITNVVSYEFLCECYPKRFEIIGNGYGNYTIDLLQNKDKYIKLFKEVKEDISLKVLDNILMYRITINKKYLKKAYELSKCEEGEYFDSDIFKLSQSEIFIDGGAYKGETTEKFIKLVLGKYKEIHIFEPDEDLYNEIVNNVKGKNINYYLSGLGKQKEILRFNKTGDVGGCIDIKGKHKVQIDTIDNINTKSAITFIKLDIEGAELDAIYGAKQTIKKYRPKMAISSYHRAEDLWKLYYEIKSINNEYSVYIRHNSLYIAETDFYYV